MNYRQVKFGYPIPPDDETKHEKPGTTPGLSESKTCYSLLSDPQHLEQIHKFKLPQANQMVSLRLQLFVVMCVRHE